MAEGVEVCANSLGLSLYFRSPEPKEIQRNVQYSVWVRYVVDGRLIEHSQRLEPSDVEGYHMAKWDIATERYVAVGVRKDHQDPRISDVMERMYRIDEEGDRVFTIGPDGLVQGKPNPTDCGEVVIYYKRNVALFFHYCTNFRTWTGLPGECFEPEDDSGYIRIRIQLKADEWITAAAINDGKGWWDNNSGRDFAFFPGTYTISSGNVYSGKP